MPFDALIHRIFSWLLHTAVTFSTFDICLDETIPAAKAMFAKETLISSHQIGRLAATPGVSSTMVMRNDLP